MSSINVQQLKKTRGLDLTVWPTQYDASYLPRPGAEHWVPEIECAELASRDEVIFGKLSSQVKYAWERSKFYRRLWQNAGVSPSDLKSLEDLSKFPVVRKEDLRKAQTIHPPFGDYLCIEMEDVSRVHGTSGTTGKPVVFGIGTDDWERIGEAHARVMWSAGIRPKDRLLICSLFSLYIGSWGAMKGAERLRSTVIPFGAGVAGQTLKALQLAQQLQPTGFYGTPSYALHLAEVAKQEAIAPPTLGLKTLFFSGEPGAGIPGTKRLIETTFGATCIDMGSMAEMTPWMSNSECSSRTGMHLWQDLVYAEVCDQETFKAVPYGSEGTLVYTHLERTSQPMIRLVSNDRARWVSDPCPCGRTYPRLPDGIYGRYDDMFTVRGANIYPSTIEDELRRIDGFGGEFQILVSRRDHMDELLIRAEHSLSGNVSGLALLTTMRERLHTRLGVRPLIEIVPFGQLPRTELKANRIIDDRNLYRRFRDETAKG